MMDIPERSEMQTKKRDEFEIKKMRLGRGRRRRTNGKHRRFAKEEVQFQ